jgi:hypothetical protein
MPAVNAAGRTQWRSMMVTFLIAAIALAISVIGCALVAPSDQGSRRRESGLDIAPGALKSDE